MKKNKIKYHSISCVLIWLLYVCITYTKWHSELYSRFCHQLFCKGSLPWQQLHHFFAVEIAIAITAARRRCCRRQIRGCERLPVWAWSFFPPKTIGTNRYKYRRWASLGAQSIKHLTATGIRWVPFLIALMLFLSMHQVAWMLQASWGRSDKLQQ